MSLLGPAPLDPRVRIAKIDGRRSGLSLRDPRRLTPDLAHSALGPGPDPVSRPPGLGPDVAGLHVGAVRSTLPVPAHGWDAAPSDGNYGRSHDDCEKRVERSRDLKKILKSGG